MKKTKTAKLHISFFATLFHKPLLIIFLIGLLPFLLWGTKQTQQIISFGKYSPGKNNQVLTLQQAAYNCPTSSNENYDSIRPYVDSNSKTQNPQNDPQFNFSMHEWTEVNEAKEPVNYGGDVDPNPPPSFGSIFAGRYPEIVKTYMIYHQKPQTEYDLCISNAPPGSFCPKVTLIGLGAAPGEPLLGLAAGRKISGDNTLMVLYASQNSITFTHSTGDFWPPDGYPIYVHDICVDHNLLAAYESDNAGGRNVLPGVKAGQVFGYAKNTDVKVTIRDNEQWMDPRAKKDWWQFGPGPGNPYNPPNLPTTHPPTQPTITLAPIQTISPTAYTIPTQVIIPPTTTPKSPTQTQIQISPKPFIPIPTAIPPPTATPTPKPFIDVKKTVENAKSVWTKIFVSFVQFTKVILP